MTEGDGRHVLREKALRVRATISCGCNGVWDALLLWHWAYVSPDSHQHGALSAKYTRSSDINLECSSLNVIPLIEDPAPSRNRSRA